MSLLSNKECRRLKSRLTRCQNKLKKASTDEDRLAAAKAVEKEVDYAMRIFEDHVFPDNWRNWERAKEDVQFTIRMEGRNRI